MSNDWISVRQRYALEIKERIIRTLQTELPNDKWDRIQQIVEDNFEKLLNPDFPAVKNGTETDFTGLPLDPFDKNSWSNP